MTTATTALVARARRDADEAAARADVHVDRPPADRPDLVQDLIAEVWGEGQRPQANLVRALDHAGTALLVARRGDGSIGVSLGFLGWHGGLHLHSHMTAVRPGTEGRGVGRALKLAQRATCLAQGVREIRWTFDPLVARNAHFNLVVLGARVRAYLPDHYGEMDDAVNAGDRSDRFEISWQLDDPRVLDAVAGRRPSPTGGALVPIPPDYPALRRRDPAAATAVRDQARAAFAERFAEGATPSWSAEGYRFATPGTAT